MFHVKHMTVHAMSDLHLEHDDIELPGGDVLVLAGDIWLAAPMRENKNDARSRSLRKKFSRFISEEPRKYRKVIIIAGNHEFYGSLIDEAIEEIRSFIAKKSDNVVLLDDEAVVIDGVAFIGSTMWASYGVPNPVDEIKIRNIMNDCAVIRTIAEPRDGWGRFPPHERAMEPHDFQKLHQCSRKAVSELLTAHSDKPCVLVTHHAATLAAGKTDPHWGGGLDEAYYSNFLDYAVRKEHNIIAAIHGHTHNRVRFDHNGVLVISNPRGYAPRERIAAEFDQDYGTFEISEEGKVVK